MCGLVSLLLLHRKVTFVDFSLTHVFFFSFSCISLFLSFSFMLDLIQFQHSSARHLYSCFFLIVLQLRVCFFFFCVNTTRVLFSHVFCSEDSRFFNRGTHSTGFSLFSVKGTKSETRSLFSSLCVSFYYNAKNLLHSSCFCLFVVVGFARVLAKVQICKQKKLKRKKHNIMCL